MNDKYYIGKSIKVEEDYTNHLDGTFCSFTKKNKPFKIDCIFSIKDIQPANIDDIISKYSTMYGSKNISYKDLYKDIDIDDDCKKNITKLKKYYKKNDKICICKKEHTINNCPFNKKNEIWFNIINNIVSNINKVYDDNYVCCRCGYFGHMIDACKYNTHIDGMVIHDNDIMNELL
jgi:hypothetical protein